MIHIPQLMLEVVLLGTALLLSPRIGFARRRHSFVLGFTALTIVLNLLEDYLGAWTMYVSSAESTGLGRVGLHAVILFDVLKLGVMAYVLSRFAIAVADANFGGGFALLQDDIQMSRVFALAALLAIGAAGAIYVFSLAEYRLGYLPALPWPLHGENSLPIPIRFWGGLRNLTGEEIVTRLGAQSILFYAFRNHRYRTILSIIFSSLYFELWHNGFQRIYLLNFTASCFFAWGYQKRRYECAALAHSIADWLAFLVFPLVFF